MQRAKKNGSLFTSVISLLLCISMLLGTTMAWFTDTVTNNGNRIVTGSLGIQLLKYEGDQASGSYKDISNSEGDVFSSAEGGNGILWEPNKTEVVFLQVKNTENLALNYNIFLDVQNIYNDNDEQIPLENVLSYAILSEVDAAAYYDAVSKGTITCWEDIVALAGTETGPVPGGYTKAAENGALLKDESDFFALVIHMDKEAGNEYQNKTLNIDIKLEAKQMSYENDAFGNGYDANAEYSDSADIELHVSPTGVDATADGSFDKPYKTLAKAAEAVSAMDHEGLTVKVLLHGGKYYLTESINMEGEAAGGSKRNKVIYQAAGDGEVEVTGYIQLTCDGKVYTPSAKLAAVIPEEALPHLYRFSITKALTNIFGDSAFADVTGDGTYNFRDINLTNTKGAVDRRDGTGNAADTRYQTSVMDYFSLRLNGEIQTIAEWPNNGEYATITEVVSAGGTGSSATEYATFKYDYDNIDNWDKNLLGQSVIRGYLGANYREEWNRISSIDVENRTVTLYKGTDFGVNYGRNWKIVNMLQEMDMPGEYYVNLGTSYATSSSNEILFYAPYELTANDVIEFSAIRNRYITLKNTSNIEFRGITFSGFRNDSNTSGVITMDNCDSITVKDCTFTGIDGASCVTIKESTNCTVETSLFYNTLSTGVVMLGGGDYNTLEHQNNIIQNNYFYNTGTKNCGGQTAAICNSGYKYESTNSDGFTVGNIIRNNVIHHGYGNMNVSFNGAEYDISYNEIYNGLRTLNDYGLIYTGAQPRAQGNQVHHNYLHDYGSWTDPDGMDVHGIYTDEYQSGSSIYNNIIVGNSNHLATSSIITAATAYSNISGNIFANTQKGLNMVDRDGAPFTKANAKKYIEKIPGLSDTLKAKYTYLMTLYNESMAIEAVAQIGNVVKNNVAYNAPYKFGDAVQQTGKDAEFANNLTSDTDSIFVDPDNHDYRLTDAYAAANGLADASLTQSNFSMDQIGIQKSEWNITNPKETFRLKYPMNGATGVEPSNAVLAWEQALFADEYTYIVASDAEFKNIVATGTTIFEHAKVEGLETGKTYYWKVAATTQGKQMAATWECQEAFAFTVGTDAVAKVTLGRAIDKAATVFATVTDGTEVKAGEFPAGTRAKLDQLLATATAIYNSDTATQAEVDEQVVILEAALNTDMLKYKGYTTVDTSDLSKWYTAIDKNNVFGASTATVADGVLTITDKKLNHYTETYSPYEMMVIDIKPVFKADVEKATLKSALRIMFRGTAITAKDDYSNQCYLVWLKSEDKAGNAYELHRRQPSVTLTDIKVTAENMDATYDAIEWKKDDWNRMVLSAIDQEDGTVRLIVTVNGTVLFDYIDTATADAVTGFTSYYFAVTQEAGLQIKGVDVSEMTPFV